MPVVAKYLGADAQIRLRERVLGQCLDEEACEVVWDGVHAEGAEAFREIVDMLGGFYVKTGQVIASRQDLFPRQYIDSLDGLTDMVEPLPCRRGVFLAEEAEAVSLSPSPAQVEPLPFDVIRAVVEREVLRPGEAFGDVFETFETAPLGAASIAQVHKATLTAKYGGPREVAVKVQRPRVEGKLLGDIAELKTSPSRCANATPSTTTSCSPSSSSSSPTSSTL